MSDQTTEELSYGCLLGGVLFGSFLAAIVLGLLWCLS